MKVFYCLTVFVALFSYASAAETTFEQKYPNGMTFQEAIYEPRAGHLDMQNNVASVQIVREILETLVPIIDSVC